MRDNNFCTGHRTPTSNQRPYVLRRVRNLSDAVVLERRHLGRAQDGLIFHQSTRYDQRGFGEPITGIEKVWAESAGCKDRSKPFQGVRTHWLGTVVRHLPIAEVQTVALFRGNLASAHFVREIRASADSGFVARNSLKPPQRPLKKGLRGHENAPTSSIQRLDDSVGESHVMENRQPCYGDSVRCNPESLADVSRVLEKVPMTDHYAPGYSGGARSILDQGQSVASRPRVSPGLRRTADNLVGS